MSSLIVAGDTSGSVTITAPAVAGTTTLTLPATNGTVLTSASSIGTSQLGSGTASSSTYLRGDQTWASISSGGMTLLGTLTTTSGSTQTLSGLTLTGYKALFISFFSVSHSDTVTGHQLRMSGINITRADSLLLAGYGAYGTLWLDLATGVFSAPTISNAAILQGATDTSDYQFAMVGQMTTPTTSSTSISFSWGGGGATFDYGTIKVYGVS
jgi:hypothetical protein